MNETGIVTKELLRKLIPHFRHRQQLPPPPPPVPKPIIDDELITSDFGDTSNIQLPYTINNYDINFNNDDDDNNKEEEDDDDNEKYNFSDYILIFSLIIILFGYIGYFIVNKRIIAYDTVSGVNFGITVGLIIINFIWSLMKE